MKCQTSDSYKGKTDISHSFGILTQLRMTRLVAVRNIERVNRREIDVKIKANVLKLQKSLRG
jgi:hypothetical protein